MHLVLNKENMKSSLFLVAVFSVLKFKVLSQNNSSISSNDITHSRIVGGYTISIKNVPWIVQLNYYGREHCGGSIVSVSKILSAAHCTKGRVREEFSIRAGTSKSLTGGQVRLISKIINHPKYLSDQMSNDISILFLKRPLKLSPSVAVIKIANQAFRLSSRSEVLAAGWGLTCESFNCGGSKTLQAVKLPTVSKESCKKAYKAYENQFRILPSMLCAGPIYGGKDTCQGDSGGPLTHNKTLIGVVSFGNGCARAYFPGVYTSVSFYSQWIRKYL